MKRKYMIATLTALILALAGVVWSQSGPTTYSLKVAPSGYTSCSALALLSPPFYKCSNMQLVNTSGVPIGTADWGYTNGILLLTLEKNGDVMNYSIPATRALTRGNAAFPTCSAEWTIEAEAVDAPQVIIHLTEYRSGGGRTPEGCRARWDEGTVTQ
jgi:hypothetical protein